MFNSNDPPQGLAHVALLRNDGYLDSNTAVPLAIDLNWSWQQLQSRISRMVFDRFVDTVRIFTDRGFEIRDTPSAARQAVLVVSSGDDFVHFRLRPDQPIPENIALDDFQNFVSGVVEKAPRYASNDVQNRVTDSEVAGHEILDPRQFFLQAGGSSAPYGYGADLIDTNVFATPVNHTAKYQPARSAGAASSGRGPRGSISSTGSGTGLSSTGKIDLRRKGAPRPSEPEVLDKLENHKKSEQRSRERLRNGFEDLKTAVPSLRLEKNPTKSTIVTRAAEYIYALEQEVESLRGRLKETSLASSFEGPSMDNKSPASSGIPVEGASHISDGSLEKEWGDMKYASGTLCMDIPKEMEAPSIVAVEVYDSLNYSYIYVDHVWEMVLGLNRRDILNKKIMSVGVGLLGSRYLQFAYKFNSINYTTKTGKPWVGVEVMRRADRTPIMFQHRVTPVFVGTIPQAYGVLSHFRVISEEDFERMSQEHEKQIEEQLRQANVNGLILPRKALPSMDEIIDLNMDEAGRKALDDLAKTVIIAEEEDIGK
eukprot:Clim_evm56s156 gene=Clim_evmTU56s156